MPIRKAEEGVTRVYGRPCHLCPIQSEFDLQYSDFSRPSAIYIPSASAIEQSAQIHDT